MTRKKPLLSPKTDTVFKNIFGQERHIEILSDLLCAILEFPKEELAELIITDPHSRVSRITDKKVIMDILVKTRSGKRIDIEIQRFNSTSLRHRLTLYGAKLACESMDEGMEYKEAKQAIVIMITDFTLIWESPHYHHRNVLGDFEHRVVFDDLIEIHTLELTKLPEQYDGTPLWSWLQFFKTSSEEELNMLAEKNENIKKAVGILEELSEDEAMRMIAVAEERAIYDEKVRLEDSHHTGVEEGKAIGLEQGKAIGVEQGKAIGLEQGKAIGAEQGKRTAALEMAQKALKLGLSVEMAMELSDLTKAEVEKLQKA